MIDAVVSRLETLGILDNTYIFYSTDKGYHIGQHRLQPSKQCAYKEDVNIPLIVRGPNVAKDASTDIITSHTDLAPTFLDLANASLRGDFDGSVIPVHATKLTKAEKDGSMGELVNVEHWGRLVPEGKFDSAWQNASTYKSLRVVGSGYDLAYTVWCTMDHELYNLVDDPYETKNLYRLYSKDAGSASVSVGTQTSAHGSKSELPGTSSNSSSLGQLLPRLDALLMVLKTCKAGTCRNPWGLLHPQGDVHNLQEAMDPRYDSFYAKQPRVHFDSCLEGLPEYLLSNELPLHAIPYGNMDAL